MDTRSLRASLGALLFLCGCGAPDANVSASESAYSSRTRVDGNVSQFSAVDIEFVYVLGTFDTKIAELTYVAERLRQAEAKVRTVDVGTGRPHGWLVRLEEFPGRLT